MDAFRPTRTLRNRHLQSITASIKLRKPFVKRRAGYMLSQSREVIVDCGNRTRLQGFYSGHKDSPRPLAILIHGWEGSCDSNYILSSAGFLFRKGLDIFRLNLRDHGNSHHLNPGVFHSCLLDEVVSAVSRIQQDFSVGNKTFLIGFSLGGNFALRVGARAGEDGPHLDKIVAICPVLHPPTTLKALDKGWFVYRRYFIRKWKRSLAIKQTLFPDLYNFKKIMASDSLGDMTEELVKQYSYFPDLDTYLNGYSLVGDVLETLRTPSRIVLSKDDPMILHKDLDRIAHPNCLSVTLTSHGGHCGFIMDYSMNSWIDRQLWTCLSRN